jgi:hypothetical protein
MVQTSDKFKENNPLVQSNMAIIVTSYEGHRLFLKKTLSQYRLSNKYVICSYDRHNSTIPVDIFNIPHSWTFKHPTYGAEKRNGWLWDIIYGAGIINLFENFEYVFTVNGDCVWDKPEGVDDVIKLLDHYDMMPSSKSSGLIHSCSMIWKRKPFLSFVSYIRGKLESAPPESYSPEVLLRDWYTWNKNSIRIKTPPVQAMYPEKHNHAGAVDHYSAYNQDSTWKELLGYRNLGGEHKWACLEHLEPVPKHYLDLRNDGEYLSKHEHETLYHYYLTQDRRWLYKYWAEGEDSYWNRRYYPITYYGVKPLKHDKLRKTLGPPSERLGQFNRWECFKYVLKDEEYEKKWKKVIYG